MSRSSVGLSLVEVLVAMTILAMIALVLSEQLFFGAKAWRTVSELSEGVDDIVRTQTFLRRQLEQVALVRHPGSSSAVGASSSSAPGNFGNAARHLTGSSDELSFVSPWVSILGQGRLFRFRLTLDNDELALSWTPHATETEAFEEDEFTGERTLLHDVKQISVRYFGSADGRAEPVWRSQWGTGAYPPELVEIDLKFNKGSRGVWPKLVVALPQ